MGQQHVGGGNQGIYSLTRRAVVASIAVVLPVARAFAAAVPASTPSASIDASRCTIKTGTSDDSIGLESFRGKILYLDFWASWCGPCLLSFPFMNQLQRNYADKGLEVLAINMDEDKQAARRFLGEHPATFRVALGPNVPCARDLEVAAMPTSLLIDRSGKVRKRHAGFRFGDIGPLRNAVEELLSEA